MLGMSIRAVNGTEYTLTNPDVIYCAAGFYMYLRGISGSAVNLSTAL